jgi:hypothetical protein
MAGDWLKVEEAMPDKPEVFDMAARLDIDPDAVAGKLIRVWSWASRNCHGDGVTKTSSKRAIDRAANVPGFADAMVSVGWLSEAGDELKFPNFDRHNSETAKERGLAFIRKQKQRGEKPTSSRTRHADVTQLSRSNRDKNGTIETKTKTEKKDCISPSPSTISARPNGDCASVMQWGKTRDDADLLNDSKIDELFGTVVACGFAHDTDEDRQRFAALVFNLRRQGSAKFGLLTRILEGRVKSKFAKSTDWKIRATEADHDRARRALKALDGLEEAS